MAGNMRTNWLQRSYVCRHCVSQVCATASEFPVLLACAFGAALTSSCCSAGSIAGGTHLVIHGTGFQMPTDANLWDAQQVLVGQTICDIVTHFTTSSRIVCLTRPLPSPTLLDDGEATMDVSVQMFSGLGQVTQARRSDAFTYSTTDTPYISWISDNAATGGSTLTLRALQSHQFEHALCRDSQSRAFQSSLGLDQEQCNAELYQIRVGETLCKTDQDELPLRATQRNGYHDLVDCKLATDQAAGRHNLTVTQMQIAPDFDSCPNMGNQNFLLPIVFCRSL